MIDAASAQTAVLVTGAAGQWGGRVAARLASDPSLRVLGVDARPLAARLPGVDFIQADVRNPLLGELLRSERVQAVVHLAWQERQQNREAVFDSNVLGTMALLGACAEAEVRQVVLKSTTAVYGARPDNPMYLPETWPRQARSAYAAITHVLEVERFLDEFCPEYPELKVVVLRFANVVGDLDTPFTRLLSMPVLPCLLGFDPLFQVIDADDAVNALAQAAQSGLHGPVNLAGDSIVSLGKLASLLGRPLLPIFHPLAYAGQSLLTSGLTGGRALGWLPLEPDYLRYPWTGDLAKMRTALGFQPQFSGVQAVQRFVEARRIRRYAAPPQDAHADDRLDQIMAERRGGRPAAGGA